MKKLVHIVPLGWEYDRVVLPIRSMHAHRVYLLCQPETEPERAYFLAKVTERLRRDHIQVIHRVVDSNLDTEGMVRDISSIIQLEQSEGNTVHINISGAGKVAAAAATLAAMAHLDEQRGVLYYTIPKSYNERPEDRRAHGLTAGMLGEPQDVPFFHLVIPKEDARLVLQKLALSPDGKLRYRDAIEHLRCAGFDIYGVSPMGVGGGSQRNNRANVALSKRVVEKLQGLKFITIEIRGRERVMVLTRAGRYMAMLCVPPLRLDRPS